MFDMEYCKTCNLPTANKILLESNTALRTENAMLETDNRALQAEVERLQISDTSKENYSIECYTRARDAEHAIESLASQLATVTAERDAWQKDFNALNYGGLRRIGRLESERDAAIADVSPMWGHCINATRNGGGCSEDWADALPCCDCHEWQYRGIQPKETEGQK